ncbi:MAG TPA: beta-xylosidase, partial [Oscillospiraceae bacterium]|nr:beta-xylosidase [Oscillospiraceae bacterium]
MHIFDLDLTSGRKPLDRYWEFCVGSCHATTALREDYRKMLTRCRKELGFRYIRFHGLFNDDMSVVIKPLFSEDIRLSFGNIDNIFDFLLSIGMKPFIELGFMPSALASGDSTVFHYKGNTSPPEDYDQWAWFIKEFINHLIDRYGLSEVRQ